MSEIVATRGGTARRILLFLGLAAAIYQLVANTTFFSLVHDVVPQGGIVLDLGGCGQDRFCEVKAVKLGTAASDAGLKSGDRLRFDSPVDELRAEHASFFAGDRVGVTLRRGEANRHVEVTAAPERSMASPAIQTVGDILSTVGILTVIAGMFVMMRGGSRLSVLLLGAGLACSQAGGPPVPFWWWRDPVAFRAFTALVDAMMAAGGILFFAFARAFRRETSGGGGALSRWAFWGLAAATGAWMIVAEVLKQTGALGGADVRSLEWIGFTLADLGYALSVLTLVAGWREAPKPEKARYGYIVPALVLIATIQILDPVVDQIGGWDPTTNPLALALAVLPLAGLLLLVYAVLRHKVIDLGFALNRTLVYGVVSAVLLAAFGLVEWGVDHFVPIEGREKNALVDAGIALGVFLAFHRVRDVVEHGVEGLFFRRWQKAEADLRRFVREAAFITDGAALMRAFAETLTQFAEGAPTAVYLAEGDGYARAAGEVQGAGARLETNLSALVSVRADPKAGEIQYGALAGALIAPMVNRNDVLGVVVLAPKSSGHGWRPDEVELIGWATRQVGLDLHALKVERLEADRVRQNEQIAVLNAKVEVLLAGRQPA